MKEEVKTDGCKFALTQYNCILIVDEDDDRVSLCPKQAKALLKFLQENLTNSFTPKT